MKKSIVDYIIILVVVLLFATTFIPIGVSVANGFNFDRGRAEGFVAFIVNSFVEQEESEIQKCDGSGFITHGDGHKTPCPGCENCQTTGELPPEEWSTEPREDNPEILEEFEIKKKVDPRRKFRILRRK